MRATKEEIFAAMRRTHGDEAAARYVAWLDVVPGCECCGQLPLEEKRRCSDCEYAGCDGAKPCFECVNCTGRTPHQGRECLACWMVNP